MAAHLEKDNSIEVSFAWEGRPLLRHTRIDEIVCDPLVPIYCTRRPLILKLMFEKHPEWDKDLLVTVDTTVADILNRIVDQHSTIREKDLIIQVARHAAKSETEKLIELDPELEGPIHVRRISFHMGMVPFNFAIEGERFTAQIDIGKQNFLAAMEAVASQLHIPPASLSIFLGDEPLDAKSRLSRAKTYRVEVSNCEREFVIKLAPELNPDLKARGWNGKHVRRLRVDLGEVKRVDHVIGYLTQHESIGPIDVVENGFSPFPKEKALALLPTGQVIMIRYRPPEDPVKYVFASITDAEGRKRCPAQDDTSVQSLKMYLAVLCGRNNFLPGTLAMKFGDLELTDDNRIMIYGIPADSLIDVTLRPMEKFYVFDLQGNPIKYFFAAPDTVSTLRAFLAIQRFPTPITSSSPP
jgi:hypothetical protein